MATIDPIVVQTAFTIIIAIATTIYVIKTADIAKASERQAIISEKLQEISQNQSDILEKQTINVDRPILTVNLEKGALINNILNISYTLHNMGTGPALAIRVFYGISEISDIFGYDPRGLKATCESTSIFLPLGKEGYSSQDEHIGGKLVQELDCKKNESHMSILYIYCFYENIFRSRYKSIYPIKVAFDEETCNLSTIEYLEPLIRPLNRYESVLEDMVEKSKSDASFI